MIANLAGNAYCAFHYMPWQCALLSTYGKFLRDPNAPRPSVPREEDNADNADDTSADLSQESSSD